jgi:hypothetical protein
MHQTLQRVAGAEVQDLATYCCTLSSLDHNVLVATSKHWRKLLHQHDTSAIHETTVGFPSKDNPFPQHLA